MDPTDAPVWGPPSGHILLNFEYARLIRSLFRRAAISSSLLVPVENIIFLIAPVAISSLLSGRAAICILLLAPLGKEYDISALRLDK